MKPFHPNVYEAHNISEAIYQTRYHPLPSARSYNIHRRKLREIKAKRRLLNVSATGASTACSTDLAINPSPIKRVPYYSNQRKIDIFVENQHLVRRIADITRRTKSVHFSLVTRKQNLYSVPCRRECAGSWNSRPNREKQDLIYSDNQKMLRNILFPSVPICRTCIDFPRWTESSNRTSTSRPRSTWTSSGEIGRIASWNTCSI